MKQCRVFKSNKLKLFLSLEIALEKIVEFTKAYISNENIRETCAKQIS